MIHIILGYRHSIFYIISYNETELTELLYECIYRNRGEMSDFKIIDSFR